MRALAAIGLALALIQTGVAWAEDNPPAPAFSDGGEENYEVVEAPAAAPYRQAFLAAHPDIREQRLDKRTGDDGGPALRLTRLWSAPDGFLMEVEGLPRPGNANSAVMRRDTLAVIEKVGGRRDLREFSGGQELRDPKGGSAIVVRPGDVVYLLFEPVNDAFPFRLIHRLPAGGIHDYFGWLDPNFRQRYDEAYAKATTPEGMKDFIVAFARNDPDGRVPQVFLALVQRMRDQKTFEGYYNAYLLMQEANDLRMASKLARTADHQAKIEHMGVATLVDKSRLLTLSVTPRATSTSENEGSCWMFCRYNFEAARPVRGTLAVGLNPRAPVKLRYGRYRVSFDANAYLPRTENRRSNWMGNRDGPSDQRLSETITVELSPPNYSARVDYDLGGVVLAFFQRGSAGGYEAHWATGSAEVTVAFKSMELLP